MKRSVISIVMSFIFTLLFTMSGFAESIRFNKYMEVQIALDDKFTIIDANALESAPGSRLEIIGDSSAVKAQISEQQFTAIQKQGAKIDVIRNFVLASPSSRQNTLSGRSEITSDGVILDTCSGPYYEGYSDSDVYLPGWSGMNFAPFPSYPVTCIDVHYEIVSLGIVDVSMVDEDETGEYILGEGYAGDVSDTVYGITYFNGEPLNQIWWLIAEEYYGYNGYIDYWWIKLYYEDSGGGYCSASGGCDEYIGRVQVGSIDKSSSCSSYADYTSISTDMKIDTGYSITITNGNGYTPDRCGIWVDWNQDEDFDDASETISVSGNPGTGPYTAVITPPVSAALGQTRMRVRIVYNQTPSPCGDTAYGEVEDYTINVVSGNYCSASGGCDEHIGRVQVGSIDNSSNCSGYADYTGISTDMEIDAEYLITVTNVYGYSGDRCGIWVDWNQDEDFADAGETISVNGNPGAGPYTAAITPPVGAVLGQTRMRVRIVYDEVPLPCDYSDFGEVEDYTINVAGATSIRLGGYVLASFSDPLSGVEVSANTGPNDVTDAAGYYEFEVSSPFTGNVSVINPPQHWSFLPASYMFTNKNTDDLNVDFTGYYSGPNSITVRGYVTTASGFGIKDVLLDASTGQQTYSGSGGYYELIVSQASHIPSPWTGTITAIGSYWSFSPPSRNYTAITADVNDANYVGTYTADPTPTITGYVKTAEGQPIKGVQIAADSYGGSAMTDTNGFYELILFGESLVVPRPYDGNVTPFKTDWSFSPPNNVYTDLAFDIHDQNYTASYFGAGCDNGWIEQWVTRYNGDEIDNLIDQIQDMAVDNVGNVYITGRSYNHLTKWDYALIKYDPNGELLWAARYGQPAEEYETAEALAMDVFGNVYVTGYTETNDIYGNHENCTTLRYPPDSNLPNWTAVYDGPDHEYDSGIDITTDPKGFVYVLCDSYSTSTSSDIVTMKYFPDSNIPIWTARYNGPGNNSDKAENIKVDDHGNVYVTGSSYSSTNKDDFVTIKYSPEGIQLWVRNYNGSENKRDAPEDITLDEFGNVYVTGSTEETSTGDNATTIKYDTDGNELWIAKFSAGIEDYAAAIVMDGQGSLYVAGSSDSSGNDDFLLIKYSTDSNQPVWVSTYDGPEGLIDSAADITADKFGNVYLAGWTNYTPGNPPTGVDFMTVKYSPDSNQPLWSAVYSGPPGSLEGAQKVVVDDAGDVIVGGYNEAMVVVKYSQCCDLGDINCDRIVDHSDIGYFYDEWLMEKCFLDISPVNGDGFVDFRDYSAFADSWLAEIGHGNYNPLCDVIPESGDGIVNEQDMNVIMEEWLMSGLRYLYADIAPDEPDGIVNFLDFAVLCSQWLE